MLRVLKKGRKLEEKGAVLLQASGYRILQSQPSKTARILVDRRAFDRVVRADFLVKKGFKRYIVEVKGGDVVRDPTSGATRRQLFEYYSCFKTPNMLFVDAVKGKIHKIGFPHKRDRCVFGFLIGFVFGAALFWFLFAGAA